MTDYEQAFATAPYAFTPSEPIPIPVYLTFFCVECGKQFKGPEYFRDNPLCLDCRWKAPEDDEDCQPWTPVYPESIRREREQVIREKAYYLWKEAGEPEGRADEFWFMAENN